MEISHEKVEKYREIYQGIYGHSIEKSRARDELTALVCLMNVIRNCGGNANPTDKKNAEDNKTNGIWKK